MNKPNGQTKSTPCFPREIAPPKFHIAYIPKLMPWKKMHLLSTLASCEKNSQGLQGVRLQPSTWQPARLPICIRNSSNVCSHGSKDDPSAVLKEMTSFRKTRIPGSPIGSLQVEGWRSKVYTPWKKQKTFLSPKKHQWLVGRCILFPNSPLFYGGFHVHFQGYWFLFLLPCPTDRATFSLEKKMDTCKMLELRMRDKISVVDRHSTAPKAWSFAFMPTVSMDFIIKATDQLEELEAKALVTEL